MNPENADTQPDSEKISGRMQRLVQSFIEEWMTDSFYWLEGGRITILQQAAFECGLVWHTGDSEYVSDDYPNNNLWFSKDGKMQSLPFWSPDGSYGEPKDFIRFIKAWDAVSHLLPNVKLTRRDENNETR